MQLSNFDFELPEALIAQFPPEVRGNSRLLHVDGLNCHDDHFSQLIHYLRPGDVLVFNDTRVLKARLFGQKLSGGQVEVLVERVLDSQQVLAHVRASKSPKPGSRLLLEGRWEAEMVERQNELFRLRFTGDTPVLDILDASGKLPLPPYITRTSDAPDDERYQTVYARHQGAVAAPTAGLHFTDAQLDTLRGHGVELAFVTLHVGAGTFQPVRVDNIADHCMHSEIYHVPDDTVAAIARAHAQGRQVMAVGTTSLRALESAARTPVLGPVTPDPTPPVPAPAPAPEPAPEPPAPTPAPLPPAKRSINHSFAPVRSMRARSICDDIPPSIAAMSVSLAPAALNVSIILSRMGAKASAAAIGPFVFHMAQYAPSAIEA